MRSKEVIVITGGAGFIGSNLAQKLIELGYHVAIFSLCDIKCSNIKNVKNNIEFYELDLLDEKKLQKTLKKVNPSLIVHLAANSNPDRNPKMIKSMMKDNFNAALNLYSASSELKNLRCIIAVGSIGEYGQANVPFVETQKEMPSSPYSFSKTCITHLSSYFYRIHDLPIVIVRPSAVYGEYQTNNQIIPFLIKKCLKNETINMTGGEQAKDFIYVKDFIDAIIKIIKTKNNKITGEIINICSGMQIKIKDIALLIKKETNSGSRINFGVVEYRKAENMFFYASNRKAKSLLNWSPKYPFKKGIKNTIRWYKGYLKGESHENSCLFTNLQ